MARKYPHNPEKVMLLGRFYNRMPNGHNITNILYGFGINPITSYTWIVSRNMRTDLGER